MIILTLDIRTDFQSKNKSESYVRRTDWFWIEKPNDDSYARRTDWFSIKKPNKNHTLRRTDWFSIKKPNDNSYARRTDWFSIKNNIRTLEVRTDFQSKTWYSYVPRTDWFTIKIKNPSAFVVIWTTEDKRSWNSCSPKLKASTLNSSQPSWPLNYWSRWW